MLKRLLCCFFFVLVVGVFWSYAQHTPTTQGKEFWVSFMRNGYRTDNPGQLVLIATAKHACNVTVTNPNKSWSQPFQVLENNVASIIIPDAQGYNEQIGATGDINKGLYVTADDTISLYIANDCRNSYDAANVLPVQALGCRYMVQTNQSLAYSTGSHSSDNRASFLIIATENNTQVQITPSCPTMDNHSDTYSVTLQRGQCYHVLSKEAGNPGNTQGDLSGTWIESLENKPIAVFSGNCVTAVTDVAVSEGLDHVFEQAMPVDNWGKQFVVTRTKASQTLQDDRVKITALLDGTDVIRNGELVYRNLSAGESRAFWLSETSGYLESSKPVAVYLYNHSHSSSNTFGDPSMVWISPVEQTLQDVIFSTFSSDNTTLTHFVNVVCYTVDASELYLNGNPIPQSQIETVQGAPQFSFARVSAQSGMNRLHCPGGLVAHVYGMGDRQGYAYTVGSSAKVLTTQLFVNGESYDNYPDGYTICQNHEVEFRVEANFDIDHVVWQFTDGYSDTGETISRNFDEEGTFEMEVYVYHDEEAFERMMAAIHVSPVIEIPVDYSTCASTYRFHGQDFPVPYFEDFIIHSEEGCDTIYHMNIQSNPSVSAPLLYETICEEDEGYLWFDTLRTEPGTYLVIAQSPAGCDSVCLLHLEVDKVPENPERAVSSCTPYHWGADIICDHTDVYSRPFFTEGGCGYDSVLHFTLLVSPLFEQIVGLSNVAVATNFWPGHYIYYLDDSTGMNTSRIQWELLDNPEGPEQWEFRPHGAFCTIVAYSMGTRTLHVRSGEGFCDKEAFKTITCSGYGVGESEMENLEVYPNPVKDELVVKGPEMLELTIYNLLGQKMKSVKAQGDSEVRMVMSDLPQALYLLEVRTERGNKTRLVSVIK